ncbi:RHS repeat-associated core domain-containing protein [Streptomyces sp. NPDC004822]
MIVELRHPNDHEARACSAMRPNRSRSDQRHDPGTRPRPAGLTHIGAREYDPAIGQFISVDPVLNPSEPNSLNGYSYANNTPVTLADPTGLDPCGGLTCGHPGGEQCSDPDVYCYGENADGTANITGPVPGGSGGTAGGGGTAGSGGTGGGAGNGAGASQQTVILGPEPLNDLSPAMIASVAMSKAFFNGEQDQFRQSLTVLQKFCLNNPAKCRGNFALTLAQVKVKGKGWGAMDPTRVVGFVSKGGLPQSLLDEYTRLGIPIYRAAANDGKGHAEGAAARFRGDIKQQTKDLGGKILRVNSAYVNIRVCSEHCARQLTKFIGRGDTQIPRRSNGMINGQIIDSSALRDMRQSTGRGRALDVVLRNLKLLGSGRASRGR